MNSNLKRYVGCLQYLRVDLLLQLLRIILVLYEGSYVTHLPKLIRLPISTCKFCTRLRMCGLFYTVQTYPLFL